MLGEQTTNQDPSRPIGSKATLNGKEVLWSGDHYGWQSLPSYEKLQINGDLNKGGDFVRNVNQLGRQALQVIKPALNLPGIKQGLQILNEANENAKETYYNPQLREQQGPLVGSINQIVGGLNEGVSTVTDYWAGKAKDAGLHPDIGRWGSGAVVETAKDIALGGAAGKLSKVASKLPPGPGMKPALAIAGVGNSPTLPPILSPPKSLAPQVMEAASTLPTPSNWQNRTRDLYGKQEHKALADMFRRGQGGKLSKDNTFITADELALNKGGALDQQLERADRMENLRKKWSEQGKEIKGDRQRELYDAASLNPNHDDIEMYSSSAARKYITKFTNVLSSDEWHHVFGNKEAGEFILSIANSDPLVAANLFKKMESLGLNSSGVSKNIAILKKAKHTNWHDHVKELGFEPKSPGKALSVKGSTAPGDFADLSQELGRAIVDGKADINDAFKMLELYSSYNKWQMQQLTSKKFGGRIVNELPEGVGKAIQIGGYTTRPKKSNYKPLPKV